MELLSLPDDVLYGILSFFDAPMLCSIGRCCWKFRALADSRVWRSLAAREFHFDIERFVDVSAEWKSEYALMSRVWGVIKSNTLATSAECSSVIVSSNGLELVASADPQTLDACVQACKPLHPIPFGDFSCGYFEIRVIAVNPCLSIGLAYSPYPQAHPGWFVDSYGFHADSGEVYNQRSYGNTYSQGWQDSDVIGCGLNFAAREIFYTRNGAFLGVAARNVKNVFALFPTIGVRSGPEGLLATANFGGRPFEFDLARYLRTDAASRLLPPRLYSAAGLRAIPVPEFDPLDEMFRPQVQLPPETIDGAPALTSAQLHEAIVELHTGFEALQNRPGRSLQLQLPEAFMPADTLSDEEWREELSQTFIRQANVHKVQMCQLYLAEHHDDSGDDPEAVLSLANLCRAVEVFLDEGTFGGHHPLLHFLYKVYAVLVGENLEPPAPGGAVQPPERALAAVVLARRVFGKIEGALADSLRPARNLERIYPEFPYEKSKTQAGASSDAATPASTQADADSGSGSSSGPGEPCGPRHLWASRVVGFSSQYGQHKWSAQRLLGQPSVYPQYGDCGEAWAPLPSTGSQEFIELEFPEAIVIRGVSLFETFNPGFAVRISTRADGAADWITLWSASEPDRKLPPRARVFSPPLSPCSVPTRTLRIDIDQRLAPSWYELDAVCISDSPGPVPFEPVLATNAPAETQRTAADTIARLPAGQWALGVLSASSSYGVVSWSAERAIGPPTVYPKYGDFQNAWAPLAGGGTEEHIELQFEEAIVIRSVFLFETFNPGYLTRISTRADDSADWITLWQANPDVMVPRRARIFCPAIRPCGLATRQLRLDIDQRLAPSWYELDAVRISDCAAPNQDVSICNLDRRTRSKIIEYLTILLDDRSFADDSDNVLGILFIFYDLVSWTPHLPLGMARKQLIIAFRRLLESSLHSLSDPASSLAARQHKPAATSRRSRTRLKDDEDDTEGVPAIVRWVDRAAVPLLKMSLFVGVGLVAVVAGWLFRGRRR